MPNLDLDPGDYRERRPRGWRWKLPWSHPEDTKLPMVGFFVCLGWLVWAYVSRADIPTDLLVGVSAFWGIGLGGCVVLWLRD